MFFSISSAFGDLTDDELRAYEMPLDNVISAHYRRNILLSMSMAMAVRIGDVISLGGVSRATLAAIKKRLPAYNVASSYAKRRIELYPDGIIDGNFELDESGVIRTSLRDFHAIYANNSPNMFVEHAINDGDLFQFLFESFGKYADLPTHLVHFRPCHSGGGTVGDVLRARNEGDRMGVCVCDRDCAPYGANPPFKPGGTACVAHDTAVALHLLAENEFGRSSRNPYFAFQLTEPRTAEGYIGPHVLDAYFEANRTAIETRTAFIDAFPNFPNLTNNEIAVWFTLNLKDAGLDLASIVDALNCESITEADVNVNFVSARGITIPKNVTKWLVGNAVGTRFSKDIEVAFSRDLTAPRYYSAVEQLFEIVWDSLAADVRIITA